MVGAAWGRVLAVALLVIAADQASKAWVRATIGRTERDGVFPGVDLVNVRNRGVAFGLLSGGRGLVLALTAVALIALLVYFARHPVRPGLWLATGLLVGGAAGNLVDRLRGDAVTDFIDLPLWPPFNVADACITLGALALLWVIEGRRGEESAAGVGDEGDPRPA